MKSLIQKLVEIPGPSGYETRIRALIREQIQPYTQDVRTDKMGNLIACKGLPGGAKMMLVAHMDEIGLIASHIDEQGFVRFLPLGSVMPHYFPGGRVRFLDGPQGVIGMERPAGAGKIPTLEQMYIDVGANSREDCPVRVGDVAAFERPYLELNGRLVSKALDDRVGVAILIEVLRQLPATPNQVFFVFSAQEEVDYRGAKTAAFDLDPDLGLAVDVTGSGDTPKGVKMETALGKGPAIKVRDQHSISDPRVVQWMARAAEKAGIPHQLEILERGSTDAHAVQISRAGVPSGCLSVPCRYIHSPSEMVDYGDVQNSVRLLLELLSQPLQLGEL